MDQKKELEKQLAVVSVLVIVSVALVVKKMMLMDQKKELEKRLAVVSVCSHCQCRPHGQRDADGQDGAVEIVNVSLVVKKMLMLMDLSLIHI